MQLNVLNSPADLASRRRGTLALEVVRTRPGFDALEADWNGLFARAGRSIHVFQTFNWCWHWANHYVNDDPPGFQLAVVTGRLDGQLVMVWPIAIEWVGGLAVATWIGEPVGQYGDVLVDAHPDRESWLRQGWTYLKATVRPHCVVLGKVRADANVMALMTEIGAISTNPCTAPYLNIAGAGHYGVYEQRYSSKARKNRRRQLRRLEEDGAVDVVDIGHGPQARDAMAQTIALKRAWLEAKGLASAALRDTRALGFFEDLASSIDRPVGLRFSALTCGGEMAAAAVGFVCQERVAMHIITYDLKFEKAAAGALLFERAIAARIAEGLGVFDLLAPAQPYKMEWADACIAVDYFTFPLTMAGWVYVRGYLQVMRPRLKAVLNRMPLRARLRVQRIVWGLRGLFAKP